MEEAARTRPQDPSVIRGLLIDYGGVLTGPVEESMRAWAGADGIDHDVFRDVLGRWFGSAYEAEGPNTPVHQVERGEISVPAFEKELASRLRTNAGDPVPADGLLGRMFTGFELLPEMLDLLRRVRAAGFRTCLLSNSWEDNYDRTGWDELFDAVVISGEVGMRKPEERIYRYAAGLVGLQSDECVFVDDLSPNIAAAERLGIRTVHHEHPEKTAEELGEILGVSLR